MPKSTRRPGRRSSSATKAIVRERAGRDFPQDVGEQLKGAIDAVFDSWNSKRAVDYRRFNKIPDDWGTAVNVMEMVFGNMGDDSGTGVAFTRNPNTGERALFGEYLTNAQGEDVVAGIRTPEKIADLAKHQPEVYEQFQAIATRLETHYRDMQDLEFTVERGKLFMLQTRNAKRTRRSGGQDRARSRRRRADRQAARRRQWSARSRSISSSTRASIRASRSPSLARGSTPRRARQPARSCSRPRTPSTWKERGRRTILVRTETNPDDVHGMIAAEGVLTSKGGATSHAAVVARGMGKPCVAGCDALQIDYRNKSANFDGTRRCTKAIG